LAKGGPGKGGGGGRECKKPTGALQKNGGQMIKTNNHRQKIQHYIKKVETAENVVMATRKEATGHTI